jgi:rhamnosyltransferase
MADTFSIIIRTKNEEEFLPQLLESLKREGELVQEVIVVDSGSTDSTLTIADQFQAKIIRIPASDFSCSYALNIGIEKAEAPLVGLFSGHSIPIYPDFLRSGQRYFSEPKVAGVYGPHLPLSNATPTERVFYGLNSWRLYLPPRVIDQPQLGLMGSSNSLFPRKLWQKHQFDLRLTEGGEDIEWALYWLGQGYKFISEPKLAVAHSHGLGLISFYHQWQEWQKNYRQALRKY